MFSEVCGRCAQTFMAPWAPATTSRHFYSMTYLLSDVYPIRVLYLPLSFLLLKICMKFERIFFVWDRITYKLDHYYSILLNIQFLQKSGLLKRILGVITW